MLSLPAAVIVTGNGNANIRVTEEILSGNPDAAAGVTLTVASHWNWHLLWNTEYTVGEENSTKSELVFSPEFVSWGWEREKKASLQFGSNYNSFDTDLFTAQEPGYFGYPKIAYDVVSRASGEEYSETVRIGDYYDVYPLSCHISGFSVNYGTYQNACAYLAKFFGIPTGEDRFTVKVYKNYYDNAFVSGETLAKSPNVTLVDASAFGRDGFYYTYGLEDTQTQQGVDRGQNTGIFFFPYDLNQTSIQLDMTKVEKICEFPPSMIPLQMRLDEEENYLYLMAKGTDGYHLFIYRRNNGMALQQEIALKSGGQEVFCQTSLVPGGILLTWNDNSFSFVAKENGQFRHWCSGIFPQTSVGEPAQNPFPRENACFFDGKRLVLSAFENWQLLCVQLAVYDESGQLYCGRYHNSQDELPGLTLSNRISPQGARIWAPHSSWSSGSGDIIVIPIQLSGGTAP